MTRLLALTGMAVLILGGPALAQPSEDGQPDAIEQLLASPPDAAPSSPAVPPLLEPTPPAPPLSPAVEMLSTAPALAEPATGLALPPQSAAAEMAAVAPSVPAASPLVDMPAALAGAVLAPKAPSASLTNTPPAPRAYVAPNPGLPYTRYTSVQRSTQINEIGVSADAPLSDRDLAYEARVRGAFATAANTSGPLDGRWTLIGPDGDTFTLQLVDRGGLEGVWRDMRRPPGSAGSSGILDQVERAAGQLTFSFIPHRRGGPVLVTLQQMPDGSWVGQLSGGAQGPASLRRN